MPVEQLRHGLGMRNAAAERDRRLPVEIPPVVRQAIAHCLAGLQFLPRLGHVEITHAPPQTAGVEPNRWRQHAGRGQVSLLSQHGRRRTQHHR